MAAGRVCGCAPGPDAVWLRETSPSERHTLLAAYLGYGLDGFDFMIYSFIMPTLLAVWHMSKAQAGYIATGALITSAVGGWAAGVLADRYGRVRVLQWTVAWFAAVHGPERLHGLLSGALLYARAAGLRLRRRMGGRVDTDRRDHRGSASRQGCRTRAKQLGDRLGCGSA